MIRSVVRSLAVVLALGSSVALAQPAGAQAEVLFRQARELMAAGKVAEACSSFEESEKLEPALSTLLNLANCREQLGQFATAWGLFLDAGRQTRSASDAPTQRLHDVAQDRARKLEPRVSRLTINVPQRSQFEGLEITRGADRVDPGLWNRALPIDGGTYTITAHAPGANQWSTQVTIAAESDTKTVEIPDLRNLPHDLEPSAATGSRRPAAAEAQTEDAEPDQVPASPHRSRAVPLIAGAGALVLLGGGLGFELWAESKYDAAKTERVSQSRRDSLYDSANSRRYLGEALAVTGLAAGGVAVWLYLRDRSAERRDRAGANVALVPTAFGVVLHGRF